MLSNKKISDFVFCNVLVCAIVMTAIIQLCSNVIATLFVLFCSLKPAEKATISLARVGSRAALSFAFAFLRRAWRSGEDSDLCSDLLMVSAIV